MSFTGRERTVPGICRKCFCTCIAFGKIYFLWCGFVWFGFFPVLCFLYHYPENSNWFQTVFSWKTSCFCAECSISRPPVVHKCKRQLQDDFFSSPEDELSTAWSERSREHTQGVLAHPRSYGSRYFSRQQKNSIGRMVMRKLPGHPLAPSTVGMSCLPWDQHIHTELPQWIQAAISFSSMVPMKYDCSAEKHIYCCYISLVYHWSTEACKHFWILCQDNKITINLTACMLEKGKRAKLEILQCIPWKKRPYLERPIAHVLMAGSCLSRELLSAPLPPSWQKITLIRAS